MNITIVLSPFLAYKTVLPLFHLSFWHISPFLYHLAEIALSDDDLDETEKTLLRKYALRMGFLEENANEITDWLLVQARQKKPLEQVLNEIN